MRVFDFNRAIVRTPGTSVVHGLRNDHSVVPDYAGAAKEHAAYVAALEALGLKADVLPALEELPDSVFVEDPALVFSEAAILLRPGAPSRLGEAGAMREALAPRFSRLLELPGEGFADGGDVLVTPEFVFIGLSARTNRDGAIALQMRLAELGRESRLAEVPAGVLHFKTAVSLLDAETVFATPAMAASGIFADFRIVTTPEGEEAAANALRINDTVLIGASFPRTAEVLSQHGLAVRTLPVDEIGKLDAGLSCMSLRWSEGAK